MLSDRTVAISTIDDIRVVPISIVIWWWWCMQWHWC